MPTIAVAKTTQKKHTQTKEFNSKKIGGVNLDNIEEHYDDKDIRRLNKLQIELNKNISKEEAIKNLIACGALDKNEEGNTGNS